MEPVDRLWVAKHWPVPDGRDDKFTRGVVGIVAGSEAYPGAAALVASAAVRTGIGLVRYVGPRRAQDLVLSMRPEVVVHDSGEATERLPRVAAWVIGPGVADHPGQDAVIGAVLASGVPIVVDAGALEACARARASGDRQAPPDRVLMTPHVRELVATLGAMRHDVSDRDVTRDRPAHARLLAETARATVLLKGAPTVVAAPGGAVVTLPDAPAWLATAGSGDVLAGVAGTLLASGLSALDAGVAASWIHARAAEAASGGGPIAALDIADAVPAVVAELLLEGA